MSEIVIGVILGSIFIFFVGVSFCYCWCCGRGEYERA